MRSSLRKALCVLCAALALTVCGCGGAGTANLLPHYAAEPESAPVRAIDVRSESALPELPEELTEKAYRDRVDELFSLVVFDRKKPLFRGESDPVKVVYDNAIAVLNGIIANSWHGTSVGEYNTVHAIHDYLACNIAYDTELYDSYGDGNTELKYSAAFNIDGALVDRVAVCDGLSKTFDFLCAIEGIESVRVTGLLGSTPHAWNKVKLFGEWYNIDVTADAANYTVGGRAYKQLSHGYFLVSDKAVKEFSFRPHVFSDTVHAAAHDYDFYGGEHVCLNGDTYELEVKSYAELEALFTAVKRAGNIGKIEVKLAYPEIVQVNLADMYRADIERAYRVFGNADFGFTGGTTPYFRYPNGVYLFLIKK